MRKAIKGMEIYSVSEIELLGECGEYERQATEFLRLTNSTLKVKYLRTGLHFNDTGTKNTRDIYSFTLSRGTRSYFSEFGASLNDTWERFSKWIPQSQSYGTPERDFSVFFLKNIDRNFSTMTLAGIKAWEKENAVLSECDYHSAKPTAYSILSCLQKYDAGTFDNFISDFGFEIHSKADIDNVQATYSAVVKEYNAICALYNDKELQALASIL